MKDETEYFIGQVKLAKELDDIHKRNVRNFNDYFKNSGKIEKTDEDLGEWIINRRKYGLFLKPSDLAKSIRDTKFDKYLKSLEVDLNKYIKKDDKEYW